MKKEIKEKIKDLLRGAITTQNLLNQGMLNEEGIDYIVVSLTDRILELFAQEQEKLLQRIKLEKKKINKRYSTDERRYPHGYNQAIADLETIKKKIIEEDAKRSL